MLIPLIGYADRLSVRPGETISFKVSSDSAEPFEARLVRVISADPNPEGPGLREVPLDAAFAGRYPSRSQPVNRGSYAQIEGIPVLSAFTVFATVWPTTPDQGEQAVVGRYDPENGEGFALTVGPDGGAALLLGNGSDTPIRLSAGARLRPRCWYRIWASFEPESGTLSVGQVPLDPVFAVGQSGTASMVADGPVVPDRAGPVTVAALGPSPGPETMSRHFNGKIESPALYDRSLAPEEREAVGAGTDLPGLVARWDFSQDISSTTIRDAGPGGRHGSLVNLPARGMTGSNWSGRETCWRHAPEEYGAIHFHDDDVYDFGWETDFAYTIPAELKSGVYAARISCGDHEDNIPFFVCPPKGTRQSDLCMIVPTFTYVIYGNHARPEVGEDWSERAADWDAYPWNPKFHPEYGLSTYNYHSDGSGICHASRLRPLLNLRSGYFSIVDARGSGQRHFQADLHLLTWLEDQGRSFDLLTDDEIHSEGVEALSGYRTVLTSSHPEYHTPETLDALQAYRDGGGRFVYLGGNGFYWRVALHQEVPGAIEIRRGEGGIRAWAAEPGEYFNAFDGAYGGLWRRGGRPPQKLAGVGFSGQGLFEGSHYRRLPASQDPRAAWIFDGIEDEILGDFGLSGGGAAGYELDRADLRLGSPEHLLVLARSEGHQAHFVAVPEEHLSHTASWSGEPFDALIRAEIVFFEAPNNGAVLSVGSITFCGSLLHNGGDNNISRLLTNVIDRFMDPDAAFPLPGR